MNEIASGEFRGPVAVSARPRATAGQPDWLEPRMRGLRPLLALAECGALPLAVAVGTVKLISANNSYITPAIVEDFRRLATEADSRRFRHPRSLT